MSETPQSPIGNAVQHCPSLYDFEVITVTMTEARARWKDLLDAAERGDEVTITRHGKPVAVLMSAQERRKYRKLDIWRRVEEDERRMEAAKDIPWEGRPLLSSDLAEEMLADLEAARRAPDAWERVEAEQRAEMDER